MYPDLQKLTAAVQHNCHISDALYAGDDTLCIYLFKMREFYRWENNFSFHDALDNKDITRWLKKREEFWDTLETEDFSSLNVNDTLFAPFESDNINEHLLEHGLIYSGGFGRHTKPHFFLANLIEKKEYNGFTVLISDKEHARDLSAPAAMTQGQTIYIRRESLQRILWEMIEQWRWNEPDNAMARTLSYYDFRQDPPLALEQLTDNELESMLLHELGEFQAGEILGDAWGSLLVKGARSIMEIMLRAIRDHLADALSTLPLLLESNNEAALHFYFANLNYMRKDLYPSLYTAYESWYKDANIVPLKNIIIKGKEHWQKLCLQIVTLAENYTYNNSIIPEHKIIELIENNRL